MRFEGVPGEFSQHDFGSVKEILELGPPAEALMTEWVHHPHMNWKHQVEVLHDLLLCYGSGPTLGAIERVI